MRKVLCAVIAAGVVLAGTARADERDEAWVRNRGDERDFDRSDDHRGRKHFNHDRSEHDRDRGYYDPDRRSGYYPPPVYYEAPRQPHYAPPPVYTPPGIGFYFPFR